MGSQIRPRTLASWLAALVVAGLMLLPGCSSAPGGLRLFGPPARARTARASSQQTFDLMPAPVRKNGDVTPQSRDPRKDGVGRVSPDGKWVAYESDRDAIRSVWVARRDHSRERRVSGTHLAVLPTWSPDGSRLLFLERQFSRPEIWSASVLDMATEKVRIVASIGGPRPAGASWFPDNRRVCYGKEDRLVVLDVISGGKTDVPLPPGARPVIGTPAVSPDGGRIGFAVADGVWVASLADRRIEKLISEPDVDAFAWAPGGRQIAFRSSRDGQWKLYIVQP